MSVVTLISFVLDVSGRDGDTTGLFLRSLVDLVVVHKGGGTVLGGEGLGDSGGQGGLTVIDVTNSTNVDVGLATGELATRLGGHEAAAKEHARTGSSNVCLAQKIGSLTKRLAYDSLFTLSVCIPPYHFVAGSEGYAARDPSCQMENELHTEKAISWSLLLTAARSSRGDAAARSNAGGRKDSFGRGRSQGKHGY